MALLRKIMFYLFYSVIIVGSFAWTQWFIKQMQQEVAVTWEPFRQYLLVGLVCIIPGILLGLEPFLREWKRPGTWGLDWVKLVYSEFLHCI